MIWAVDSAPMSATLMASICDVLKLPTCARVSAAIWGRVRASTWASLSAPMSSISMLAICSVLGLLIGPGGPLLALV